MNMLTAENKSKMEWRVGYDDAPDVYDYFTTASDAEAWIETWTAKNPNPDMGVTLDVREVLTIFVVSEWKVQK